MRPIAKPAKGNRKRVASRRAMRFRAIRLEQLESRRLLVSDFTNTFNPYDIDDDGFVAPIDALTIINALNARPQPPLVAGAPFLDQDGDGVLAPVDALNVINLLNAGRKTDVIAMGEGAAFVNEATKV